MSVLAQCGFGRGEKIHRGLDEGSLSGVILSPRDEARPRLENCAAELRASHEDAEILFDPQFYAATLRGPRDGHLPEYDYYSNNSSLSRTQFGPRHIQRYVNECLEYQHVLRTLSYLISPSVLFEDFRDSWSQIALSMGEAAIDYHAVLDDAPPLLISVVTSEAALRNPTGMNEFLDALSSLEAEGFYLLVARTSGSYRPAMDAVSMENLLYFVHVLGALNQYHVKVGFTDWFGFILEAAGASSTACGWHQGLRQFSMARYEPATGGRRPRKRYSSRPLLSSVLITPELEDIYRVNRLPQVLSGSPHDGILAGGPAAGESDWSDQTSCLAHWWSLNSLSQEIAGIRRVPQKLDRAAELIDSAQNLYSRLVTRGVNFESQTGPEHLESWLEAIRGFRTEAGV